MGVKRRGRFGLDGAEAAKKGWNKEFSGALGIVPQCGLGFDVLVGEDSGGVMGALLDIRRGGSGEKDVNFRKIGRLYEVEYPSQRDGLGKDEDVGLAW